MRLSSLVSVALLCGGIGLSPAFAAGQAAAPTQGQAADIEVTGKPEKKVCIRDQTVGSRLGRTVCLTQSEWKARDQHNEHERNRLRDRFDSAPVERMLPGEPIGPS